MKEALTQKQKRAQEIIKSNISVSINNMRFMYSPRKVDSKRPIIVVSIAKKTAPKATQRNILRRQIKGILMEQNTASLFTKFDWMVICKTSVINKELRDQIIDTLTKKLQ